MTEPIPLGAMTKLPLRPERILGAAYDTATQDKFRDVVVLGWEGKQLYFASSTEELGEVLILLEAARDEVMESVRRQHS